MKRYLFFRFLILVFIFQYSSSLIAAQTDSLLIEVSNYGKILQLSIKDSVPHIDKEVILELDKIYSNLQNNYQTIEGSELFIYDIAQINRLLHFYILVNNSSPQKELDSLLKMLLPYSEFLAHADTIQYKISEINESKNDNNQNLKGLKWKCCKIDWPDFKLPHIPSPSDIFEAAINYVKNILVTAKENEPEKFRELASYILGMAIEVEAQNLYLKSTLHEKLTNISIETISFLHAIQNPAETKQKEIIAELASSSGIKLKPDQIDAFNTIMNTQGQLYYEAADVLAKCMKIEYKLNKTLADALHIFAKYLMLSGSGFPKAPKRPKTNLQTSNGTITISQGLLSILSKKVSESFNSVIDSNSKKTFRLVIGSGHTELWLNQENGSFRINLSNVKLKGISDFGGIYTLFSPDVTLTVNKINLQLSPEFLKDKGVLRLTPFITYLDIEDIANPFDKMISWYIQKNILDKFSYDIEVSELMKFEMPISNANKPNIIASPIYLTDYAITYNQVLFAIEPIANAIVDVKVSDSSENKFISLNLNEYYVNELVKSALSKDGIKFSLKKNAKEFKESDNYLWLKSIDNIEFIPQNKYNSCTMRVKFECEFSLKNVLGIGSKKQIRTNIELDFDISLSNYPDAAVYSLKAYISHISISKLEIDKKTIKRIERISLNLQTNDLFNVPLKGFQNISFKHPINKSKKISISFNWLELSMNKDLHFSTLQVK